MHTLRRPSEKFSKVEEIHSLSAEGGFFFSKTEILKILEDRVMVAFILGREWRLSLAELIAVFGERFLVMTSETVAVFSLPIEQKASAVRRFQSVGGSIRMIEIVGVSSPEQFHISVVESIKKEAHGGKYTFALGQYGGDLNISLFGVGIRIKKILSGAGISSRIANKDDSNLHSAVFKKEKLSKSGGEWNLLSIGTNTYLGKTLVLQDIDDYARRDTAKVRDMNVGMMPPKLVQILMNLSQTKKNGVIYDPFCGLGTTLIEALHAGYTKIYGSDRDLSMVEASQKSVDAYVRGEIIWQERIRKVGGTPQKDFSSLRSDIFRLDARTIGKGIVRVRDDAGVSDITIISEGYLGEVMLRDSITLERVQKERFALARLYDDFFASLQEVQYEGTIAMTFPFWNIHGTLSFFREIQAVINKYGYTIVPLFSENFSSLLTPTGSLLYRRDSQNVGREVVLIQKS